jgi:hypothetical protein
MKYIWYFKNCIFGYVDQGRYFDSIFFYSTNGGWSPTGSTRYVSHQLDCCTCPGWLWGWRIWWNDDWQGKPKYSEKTYPSVTFSTTNPTWSDRARTRAASVGSQRLTAWASTGAGFLRVLRFPPANHHSTNFSTIIITLGWHDRLIGGSTAEWTQSDSTPPLFQ